MGQRQQAAGHGLPRRKAQSRQSRPVPRFDMNLGDLFNDANSSPNNEQHSRQPMQQPSSYVRREYGNPEQSTLAVPPDQASQTYPQRAQSAEYYSNAGSPQAQQPYFYGSSPQSASPASVAAPTYNTTTNNNNNQNQFQAADQQQQQQENQPSMGLDFSNFDSRPTDNNGGGLPVGSDGNTDYSSFMSSIQPFGNGVGQGMGIDLGFGLAVDFQHDWSEGANYDLLEGFFFGGSGGNPGVGDG